MFKEYDGVLKVGRNEMEEEGVCPVCLQDSELVKADLCEHKYCVECWRGYIKEKLDKGEVFFGCMEGCK